MIRIFISYRRSDSKSFAHRLHDRLRRVFGRAVFMDVSDIEPGADFPRIIEERLKSCRVLVAVIGKTWVTCGDDQGRRRLDNPDDYVRLEVAKALARDILVIPLLVNGAAMPQAGGLPDELKAMATRNAVQIDDERFAADLEKLIAAIRPIVPPRNRWPLLVASALAAGLLAFGGYRAYRVLEPDHGVRLVPNPRLWSNLPQQPGSVGMRYELVVHIDGRTATVSDLTRTIVYTGADRPDLERLRSRQDIGVLTQELNTQFARVDHSADVVAELARSALLLPASRGKTGARVRVEVACYESSQGTMRGRAVWFTTEFALGSKAQSVFLKPNTQQCELAAP
jgi:hypothetical protein